jgi:hypothetical protein
MRQKCISMRLEPYTAVLLAVAVLLAAWVFWALWPSVLVAAAMSEGGHVENLTVAGYGIAAAAAWVLRDRRWRPGLAMALVVVLLAFGARELDWHRSWTGVSVLKLSFYFGSHSIASKLMSAMLVGIVAVAMAYVALWGAGPLRNALRQRRPVAITVATFLVVMVVSKLIDRSLNLFLEIAGRQFDLSERARQLALEESLELLLPVFVVVALLQHARRPPVTSVAAADLKATPNMGSNAAPAQYAEESCRIASDSFSAPLHTLPLRDRMRRSTAVRPKR